MENGWIKLHRKILVNPLTKKPYYLALWITLLLKANHEPTKMIWNNDIVVINKGEFITGRKQLAEQTGISETTIERILDFLVKDGQIGQQKTTKYRLITILNWKTYQESDNKRTTNGQQGIQQADTNKKDKNIKNDKKDIHASMDYLKNIPLEEMEEFVKRFSISEETIKSKAEDLILYCQKKGRVYKNYRAFLLNALKQDFKPKGEIKSKYANLSKQI